MQRTFRHGEETLQVSGSCQGRRVRIETPAGARDFEWEELGPGDYLLRLGNEQQRCVVAREGAQRWLWIGGRVHHLRVATARNRAAARHAPGELVAPMPGQVLQVLVRTGERVAPGQPLVVLEAMKMRFEITAPRTGRVSELRAREGAQVAGGEVLVRLGGEAPEEEPEAEAS
jgi:biotin carboxyl carrier protein